MMKNIITSPYRKMKVLLILPVFALVLYSFARPEYKYKYLNDSTASLLSTSSEQKSVKGKVVSEDNQPLPGASVVVQGTTMGSSADINGYFKIENVPEDGVLITSFIGYKSKKMKPDFNSDMTIIMIRDTVKISGNDVASPLYVVDGVITPKAEAEKIPNERISSVNVLKKYSDKYGEKGKNGVVEITTKKEDDAPLIVIDGVVSQKGISDINQEEVESMTVLKDESAKEKYGEKGKNGVIEIITKGYKPGEKRFETKIDKENGVHYSVTKDEPQFVAVEEMPEFPGGRDAMMPWIEANIKYPDKALKAKIEGKVYVNFTVSATGKVKDAVVTKSVSPLLNDEAIRVINSMPEWKPGKQAGKAVAVKYNVPVEFKLK